jgi:hypothetical protein
MSTSNKETTMFREEMSDADLELIVAGKQQANSFKGKEPTPVRQALASAPAPSTGGCPGGVCKPRSA